MKSPSEHQALTVKNAIQPLVITPSPVEGESLPGFILRTAELNGYESPMKLLHYAGMNENEARSARPPLDKLAPLFSKTVEQLKATGLDLASQFQGRYIQVMGHSIPSMFTRCKHASVCLECVKENGFIDGYHELKYAVACPKHQVRVVNTCLACHRALSWHRAGLTRCSCGADLSQATPEKITDSAVLALLGVLYAKMMKQPLNKVQLDECGFPKQAMEQLSIQTLLSVIYRFGLFNSKTKVGSTQHDTDLLAVQTTAEALSNWPHRFHDYIEKTHAPTANLKVSGLRGQFNSFYESFFKNIAQDQELAFMREAFHSFGQQRWKKAAMDPKRKGNTQSSVVGINGLAKVTHIHPHTLRGLVAKGLIEINGRSDTAQPRDVFDLSRQQRFAFAEGKSLSVKKAAEMLDIPVEVLRAYRAQGLYQARFLAIPVVLFHERDVAQLKQQLMQDCTLSKVFTSKQQMTLAQMMRMKLSAEIKALFIAAVKDRSIKPVGKLSEQVSDLIFDVANTKKYLLHLKHSLQGGISFEEAKASLKVERDVLLALVKADVLQCFYTLLGMRISEQSLIKFQDQYISCQEVARLKCITQKSLLSLCEVLGVPLFQLAALKPSKRNIGWLEKVQMALLGIQDLEQGFAEAA